MVCYRGGWKWVRSESWRVDRELWRVDRELWRVDRESWRVERRDSVELLARANTLSDVAICEGSWLYMEGCGWGCRGG